MSDVIGDVCGFSLKGISKEIPWPGSRCGWVEFYNRERDPVFERFAQSLLGAKMLEVCSTTLPQRAIPRILGDPRYSGHLAERAQEFERRADEACQVLQDVPGISVNRPQGAFYMTVLFDRDALNDRMVLEIANPEVRVVIEELLEDTTALDFRFVYHLMGATGIVVVPLSSFACDYHGFRITLLECDTARRRSIFETLARSIRDYLASGAPAAASQS